MKYVTFLLPPLCVLFATNAFLVIGYIRRHLVMIYVPYIKKKRIFPKVPKPVIVLLLLPFIRIHFQTFDCSVPKLGIPRCPVITVCLHIYIMTIDMNNTR